MHSDWVLELKSRVKRNRRLATLIFYLTDLLYLDLRERRRFLGSFRSGAILLNLGAGFRSSPPGFLAVDREAYPDVDLRADLCALPLLEGTVDGILCETVLEHVPDAPAAIGEFARVLKPGGRLYVAVPFLWPYHASPHDYWRWTASGVERDFGVFEKIDAGLSGGPTTTLVNVHHEWLAVVLSLHIDVLYRLLYLALMPARHRHSAKVGALFYYHGRTSMVAVPEGVAAAGKPMRRATR